VSERFRGENVEIATQMFIWWNLADHAEPNFAAIDPGVEGHTPLSSTQGGPYRGHEGVRRWIADIDNQFEEWYSRPDEFRELEDGRVLVLGDLHMRGRGSGIELDQPMGWILSFRDGRMYRYEVFPDPTEALRAAGLGP
jgi:ketosteroid isomerase-like protein